MYLLTLCLVLSAFLCAIGTLARKVPAGVPIFLVAFYELFRFLVGP